MFIRLAPENYGQIAPLVAPLGTQHLILLTLLDGSSPGTIYVDRPNQPQAAFITSAEGRFLLGSPSNPDFNRALRFHVERLFAGEREAWEEEFVLTCYPDEWAELLRSEILPFRPPFVSQRHYYQREAAPVEPSSASLLPTRMELQPIRSALLERDTLANREAIDFWITKNFGSRAAFALHGDGLALLHENKVVSWSLTDGVWGNHCEIGIESDVAYRRQGLATLVTRAMVELCGQRGWNSIGWHCWHHNLGSIGVAENAGFQRRATYNAYVALYDPLMHLAVQGYAALRKEDFATAAHWYGQVAELENAPEWAFYQLARCQAMLNNPHVALTLLQNAVEHGWRDEEGLRNHAHFAALREFPAWHDFLARLREE